MYQAKISIQVWFHVSLRWYTTSAEVSLAERGLALAERYYSEYGARARALKAEGRPVLGYLCALVPVEIIHAAGLIPLRIKGFPEEPISDADANMETVICSVVRAWYDVMLRGHYDYLDGLVIPHACDSMVRTFDVWSHTLDLPYTHFIDLPHSASEAAPEFYKAVLNTFRQGLAQHTGREITDANLAGALKDYNDYRLLVHQLYALRREHPPRITGTEVTRTLVAGLGLPLAEAHQLVSEVIAEAGQRPAPKPLKPRPRVMTFGAEQDSIDFISVVEETGADVVADFFCPGLREYGPLTPVTADPLDGIVERYLNLNCARTYRDGAGGDAIEARFGEIRRIAEEYDAAGVILIIRRCCDPFGFEVPALKKYLEKHGLPTLYLEEEYATVAGRLATRVQAFLEMLPPGD